MEAVVDDLGILQELGWLGGGNKFNWNRVALVAGLWVQFNIAGSGEKYGVFRN